MILKRALTSVLLALPILNSGCASVKSTVKSTVMAATTTALEASTNMTETMTAANSTLNSTVTDTVTVAKDAVGTTVNYSAVTVGELTGITTLVKAGQQMTPRQSYHLGRLCAARVLSNQSAVPFQDLSGYVNTLGKYLAMHSQSPQIYKGYQFVVLNGSAPQAISTPGGFVLISMGMLSLAQTEDELAAVLAHEIAHISLKHAEAAIQTANRLDVLGGVVFKTAGYATNLATETVGLKKVKVLEDLQVLKVFEIFDAVTDVVLNTGFNQPQELDADIEALSILKNAGYDPKALGSMIARLSEDTSFVGLHPGSAERMRILDKEITKKRSVASLPRTEEALAKSQARFRFYKENIKPVDTVYDRY